MATTKIEYAVSPDGSAGRNWSFFPGCLGPDGKPCPYCWSRNRVLPRMKCAKCRSLVPHFHPERMDEPLHVKKPTTWLVNFAGDWMGGWIEPDIIRNSLQIMAACPQHRFLTLTKNPMRLKDFSFPTNCWVGASATNAEMARRAMIELDFIQAKVKFLSIEPLLDNDGYTPWRYLTFTKVQWVIIGAATGCKDLLPPKIEWVAEIVEAADKAGVKLWLKRNLDKLLWNESAYAYPDWAATSGSGKGELRQELPEVRP